MARISHKGNLGRETLTFPASTFQSSCGPSSVFYDTGSGMNILGFPLPNTIILLFRLVKNVKKVSHTFWTHPCKIINGIFNVQVSTFVGSFEICHNLVSFFRFQLLRVVKKRGRRFIITPFYLN